MKEAEKPLGKLKGILIKRLGVKPPFKPEMYEIVLRANPPKVESPEVEKRGRK